MTYRCSKLAGQCTGTGDHWDHLSPKRTIPGLHGTVFELRLEEWDEAEQPVLTLYSNQPDSELDVRRAVQLATGLLRLAAVLVVAEWRARRS